MKAAQALPSLFLHLTGGCGGVGAGAWKLRAKKITQIDDSWKDSERHTSLIPGHDINDGKETWQTDQPLVGITFQLERILYLVHISIFEDRLCPNREVELEGVLLSMWQNTQLNKMEPRKREDVGKQLPRA
ncbi:hypothetical protein D5086_011650 [Populus alba]|uniref:Uncharacterized protein n=1 Tax=Populus alba TaxID=43335 RepID=A0ACC4CEF2_POPAL